jgi:hypothetical protein
VSPSVTKKPKLAIDSDKTSTWLHCYDFIVP